MTAETLIIVIMGSSVVSLYAMYRYFNDNLEASYERLCEKMENIMNSWTRIQTKLSHQDNELRKELDLIHQKIKDESQINSNCCKAGIQQSNFESFRLDERIRRLEQVFSKEKINKKGERVITVVMPNLEEVPSATVPLGESGVDPRPDPVDFYPQSMKGKVAKSFQHKVKPKVMKALKKRRAAGENL